VALALGGIVLAVLIAIPVLSNLSAPPPEEPPPPDEEAVAERAPAATEEVQPPAEEPPPVVAAVIPPTQPSGPTESDPDAAGSNPEAVPEGAGPPRLFHEPVARGIRGQSVSFQVQVEPPGSYRSTVWYRAVPDGAWQTSNVDGGAEGSLTVVIPAGVWISQEATDVEYFIEVAGPGGLARSASAVRPYSFRLF
jgi:hypothetical protein